MRSHLMTLAVAAAVTVAVGLLSLIGWPGYVIGAALALALWVMLSFGVSTSARRGATTTKAYAGKAVFAVALGYAFFRLGDRNAVWWAPAFIVTGALTFASANATRSHQESGVTGDQR